MITFKMNELLISEVDRLASSLGISRSEVIRKALAEYLKLSKRAHASARELNVKRVTLT